MKTTVSIMAISMLFIAFINPSFANNDQILLNAFHKYGITKCDSFILENSKLEGNWNFFINKHAGGIDGPSTEVTMTRIYGSTNDTVKLDDTYIQTAKSCFLRQAWTVSFPGDCQSNIDHDKWHISKEMPGKDYTTYKNAQGIEMHAKEISLGNFKACIQEASKRIRKPHDK